MRGIFLGGSEMKKLLTLALAVLTAIFSITAIACSKDPLVIKESDEFIVITVSSEQMEITNDSTLLDYMNSLKQSGDLEFEINNGMVSSINGIDNPADWSSCWMIYTDDAENSNTAWGTAEYNGKTYGSAIFGAESLKIKDGCIYIFVFQAF